MLVRMATPPFFEEPLDEVVHKEDEQQHAKDNPNVVKHLRILLGKNYCPNTL
jgi:hypothetical protein